MKIIRFAAAALAGLVLLSGCGKKEAASDAAGQSQNNTATAETATAETEAEAKVCGYGGDFLAVGSKVYFVAPEEGSITRTVYNVPRYRRGGKFFGESALMCYDTVSDTVTRACNVPAETGALTYAQGHIFGTASSDVDDAYVYDLDLKTGKYIRFHDGFIDAIDTDTGDFLIRSGWREAYVFRDGRVYDCIELTEESEYISKFTFKNGKLFYVYHNFDGEYDHAGIEYAFLRMYDLETKNTTDFGCFPAPDIESFNYDYYELTNLVTEGNRVYLQIDFCYENEWIDDVMESVCYSLDMTDAFSLKKETSSDRIIRKQEPSELFDAGQCKFESVNGMEVYTEVETADSVGDDLYVVANGYITSENYYNDMFTPLTLMSCVYYRVEPGCEPKEIHRSNFSEIAPTKEYFVENPGFEAYAKQAEGSGAKALEITMVNEEPLDYECEENWQSINELDFVYLYGNGDFVVNFVDYFDQEQVKGYMLLLENSKTGIVEYAVDVSEFIFPLEAAPDYMDALTSGWTNDYTHAYVSNGILYASFGRGMTYSEIMPASSYLIAVRLSDGELLWKSGNQTCNSSNFIVMNDVIICGYGFTAEDDYIYQLDKKTGKIVGSVRVNSAPEEFYLKDGQLYVVTYDTNYIFDLN